MSRLSFVPFGKSPVDKLVRAFMERKGIDANDVTGYRLTRSVNDIGTIEFSMAFEEVADTMHPYGTHDGHCPTCSYLVADTTYRQGNDESKLHSTCIDITRMQDRPHSKFICGPDCSTGEESEIPTPVHEYTSTACLHDLHERCASPVRLDGEPKIPAVCKWCPAPCQCECHKEESK